MARGRPAPIPTIILARPGLTQTGATKINPTTNVCNIVKIGVNRGAPHNCEVQ